MRKQYMQLSIDYIYDDFFRYFDSRFNVLFQKCMVEQVDISILKIELLTPGMCRYLSEILFRDAELVGMFALDKILLKQVELKHRNFLGALDVSAKDRLTIVEALSLILCRCGLILRDLRYINAALKLLSNARSTFFLCNFFKREKPALSDLRQRMIDLVVALRPMLDVKPLKLPAKMFGSRALMACENGPKVPQCRVVVFSPSVLSSYTLAVLVLLQRRGFFIEAVICKRLLNTDRILFELRRDGMRLIKKIIRKVVLRDRTRVNKSGRNLSDCLSELAVHEATVKKWCSRHSVPIVFCDSLNEPAVESYLKHLDVDYGLFTGGGIINSKILDEIKGGVLNCHAGLLPKYRGMDVIEWPVLENVEDGQGLSVHLMSKCIDEGAILSHYQSERNLDVLTMRRELESYAPYLLVSSLCDLKLGNIFPVLQMPQDGRQYFVMDSTLFEMSVNNKVEVC